jgi:hypothetical protein
MGSGFRTFAASEILTAANVNNYLMSQAVMSFANAAARDAVITAPAEGMVAVLQDINVTTIYSGSAWIRFGQYGAGTTWVPALTATTTNPNIGTAGFFETSGVYSQNGNIVTGWCRIAAGSGAAVNAGSGTYEISLPVNCKMGGSYPARGVVIGSGFYEDSSAPAANYVCTALAFTATAVRLRTIGGSISSTLPGLAANDIISFNFTYEAA